jgi:hypothetical protein
LAHAIIFCSVKSIGIDFDAVPISCFLCDLVELDAATIATRFCNPVSMR